MSNESTYQEIEFTMNLGITMYRIRMAEERTYAYKDNKRCSVREAIWMYLPSLLDSGDFKHSHHVTINAKKENKSEISAIFNAKINGTDDAWEKSELRLGLELLRRLK